MVRALEAASMQLGLRRPVTLLLHPGRTIPVVWGILRCRLLLPAAARHWSGEQLRSVLLHELAHFKRRDTMAQLLAQIACALHWFNPLVSFAAWRLGVERERACDDLVLASGVRPSAYAGHLLGVVTGLSPGRWTQSCGLAMAGTSSLEGRLVAVLSEKLNRRGVSAALAAIALAIAVGIAVPLAMLRAADERPGAPTQQETQKPKAGAKLKPASEAKLAWGEAVNGLRMALAWPPSLGEPAAGEAADLYAAVQNVSDAPVRLCTTADAPQVRWLDLKDKAGIMSRMRSEEPSGVDVTLQPREVVFLRLLPEGVKELDKATAGAMIASAIRQQPEYTLKAALEIASAPAGAWKGKLTTPDTRAVVGADAPKNRKARALFKVWLYHARLSGRVPGGFIARVGERVQEFVRANAADKAGAPYAKRMEPLLPRLDGTRDWQPAEAAALLNDIAAVSDAPLSVMLEEIAAGKIQHGLPLEKELANAPWGEPLSNGLRTACFIGPGVTSRLHYVDWVGNVVTRGGAPPDKPGAVPAAGAAGTEIRLGTPLGCRILIHNAGKEPVVFRTRSWHHIEPTAKNATGAEIGMESVTRFTRAPLMTWRLEPGRYIEVPGPSFGLGKYGFHDFKNADIATWIGAQEGDEVTLTPGPLPLNDWNEAAASDGEPRWWLDFITARLSLVTPLPSDAAERRELLRKAMADLFLQGTNPTDEETAALLKDTSPQALAHLAERIFHRPGVHAWAGPLQSGPTKFRVLPADPKAPKPPERPAAGSPPASSVPADKPATPPPTEKSKTSGAGNPGADGGADQSAATANPQPKDNYAQSAQERHDLFHVLAPPATL